MANAKPTETDSIKDTENVEAVETGTEAPAEDTATLGRPKTRQPGGKTLSAYFDKDEYDHIVEAGFVKRHRTDSKLVHAAVLEYIKDVPKPE